MSESIPPRPDLPRGEDVDPPVPTGEERPPPATWRPLEAVPVFAMATLSTFVVVAAITELFPSCSTRFILSTLTGEIAFFLSVYLWVRYVNRGSVAALGASRRPWRDAGVGVLAGVALIVIGSIALALIRAAASVILGHEPPQPQQVVSCVTGSGLLFLAPVVILAVPLGEETFFRGFLYKALRRRFSVPLAAVFSSVVFAAVHVDPLLIASLFVVGLGLAFVYERRQSLVASVAAHATFNLVGFLFIALSRR